VSGTFTVENRGGVAAGAFAVQLVLSDHDMVGPASVVLATYTVPGLGAGRAFSPGGSRVTLPGLATATAAGLPASGPVSLGLRIDPAGAVPERNAHDQGSVHRGADWEKLTVLTPVTASGRNLSLAGADVLANPNSRASGFLAARQAEWYRLTVPADARLTLKVTAATGTLAPLLTLAGPGGQVLIQSDNRIVQYLPPGSYAVSISAVSGAGAYQLTSEYVPASPPFGSVDPSIFFPRVADLNNDGIPDLVSGSTAILGNGDGTFGPPQTVPLVSDWGKGADVNGDGIPDRITIDFGIIHGGRPPQPPPRPASVSVLLGNGDGTFRQQQTSVILSTFAEDVLLAVADVNGDGIPDIVTNAVGVSSPGRVNVLLGNGDGTFRPPQTLPVDSGGYALAVVDVNGDGKPDIVSDNYQISNDGTAPATLSLLLGNGDGTFQPPQIVPTGFPGRNSYATDVADVNGDGKPDIVTSYSMLLGNGDGTFQSPLVFGRGSAVSAVADLNGDGKPDLVVQPRDNTGSVVVLLANSDGTFQVLPEFSAGFGTYAGLVADVNGDGRLDVVTARPFYNTVGVLLGNGDGAVGRQHTFAAGLGFGPQTVAVVDVNGDGKPDLVTANTYDNAVGVLLGNGDGTFGAQHNFAVGSDPVSLAVADVNGDGQPDLVTANIADSTVSVLQGNGDGTFGAQHNFAVGSGPVSLAVADVNGDGKPDLVVGSFELGQPVSVLEGNGDGTFQPRKTFPAVPGTEPRWVAVADVNGDGKLDILTAGLGNPADNSLSILLGNGDGSFRAPISLAVGGSQNSLTVADVNGDGKPDITVGSNYGASVLLGTGDATFQPPKTIGFPTIVTLVAVADVNRDGKPDLVFVSFSGSVIMDLGHGDGTFSPLSPSSGVGLRNTPYLADLNGDGLPDSVVLDRSGNILFRQGLPGAGGRFAPPVVLNPGRPARDLTLLRTAAGWAVAAADLRFDPALSGPNHFVYTVSLYKTSAGGAVTRTTAFSTTLLPTRLAAADLSGNGLDDLVAADSLDDSIQIAFQLPDGSFSAPLIRPTGQAPSDLALADVTGGGLPDIVVSNQADGDVSVFPNDPVHAFAASYRFRAGTSLYGLDTSAASPTVSTVEQSVSLAAADFTGGGRNDVVVVNRGSRSFTVLPNDGSGGFAEPQAALTASTSDRTEANAQPGPVVSGDFDRDGKPDLAILMEDRGEVWIYTNQGGGRFTHTFSIPVGSQATGLTVVPGGGPGLLDLLVGNQFGDVLHLVGRGDGNFHVLGSQVSLDVEPGLLGGGRPAALVADQLTDRVTVQAAASSDPQFAPVETLAAKGAVQLAPGAVQWARLDKNSYLPDAVVVGSGSNDILVYRTLGLDAAGRPVFAPPQAYFVGTDPVSVTIQDVNGDGIPDMLVADAGSNDVAELFGSYDASGNWVATAGPRLKTGGIGPVGVTVRDNGPGKPPDLVVTNGGSGTMTLLPGVGQGFFSDQAPQTLVNLGSSLPAAPVFTGPGVGVAVTTTGQLAGFDLNTRTAGTVFTPPAGEGVTAVQALADGNLVVAEQGGGVEELGLNADLTAYQPVESFTSLTGIPSEPSALAILDNANEVLVTNAGEDQIFVFVPASPSSSSPVALGLTPLTVPANPVAEASAPSAVPLTLVVTLEAGLLPSGEVAAVPAGADQASGTALVATGAAGRVAGVDPAGDEGGEALDAPEVAEDCSMRLRIDDILRRLRLYQRVPEDGMVGVSWRALPDVLAVPAEVLADCWRAVGEGLLSVEEALGLRSELPVSARAPAGTGEPPVDAEAADAVLWLEGADGLPGPAAEAARAVPHRAGPDGTRAAVPPSGVIRRAAALLVPGGVPDWERALLAALAVGGAARWAGSAYRRQPPAHLEAARRRQNRPHFP
jgi:hypothetical protein